MSKSKKVPFWSTHLSSKSLPENIDFCAGRDVAARPMADAELLPYDIWTNSASALALAKANIITPKECQKLLRALAQIAADFAAGKRALDPRYEDMHMNIEIILGNMVGTELAGKIHTGRSRNDQSATDVRLFLREAALQFETKLFDLAALLLELAAAHKATVCPGFSHGQPAMVTTFGHLLLNYLQALERDIERFNFFFKQVNRSPLGAAAGFGTSWPLDRELMAQLLGFERVEENSLDAVGSKGELESLLAYNLAMTLNHLAQIANDLYFMGHPYVGLVRIDDSLVTGSSIMPQKKNPDILEVLRAKATLAQGYLHSLGGLVGKNLSGYNRDFQWAKYPMLDVVNECQQAPAMIQEVLRTLKINNERMKELASRDFLNAVEIADLLARQRTLSFREGYKLAGLIVKSCVEKKQLNLELAIIDKVLQQHELAPLSEAEKKLLTDPLTIINNRQTSGSASVPLITSHLKAIRKRLREHQKPYQENCQRVATAKKQIAEYSLNT